MTDTETMAQAIRNAKEYFQQQRRKANQYYAVSGNHEQYLASIVRILNAELATIAEFKRRYG